MYLAEIADDAVADRFLIRAEASFLDLANQPHMGAPVTTRRAELAGLRRWRVKDFEHHLIFYFPRSDGVAIARVLHANQDWWRALGVDTSPIHHPNKRMPNVGRIPRRRRCTGSLYPQ